MTVLLNKCALTINNKIVNAFEHLIGVRHQYTHMMRNRTDFSEKPYLDVQKSLSIGSNVTFEYMFPCEDGVFRKRQIVTTSTTSRLTKEGVFNNTYNTIASPLQRFHAFCSEEVLRHIHIEEFGWDSDPSQWTLAMAAHFETLVHTFPKLMNQWLSHLQPVDIEYSYLNKKATPIVIAFSGASVFEMDPLYEPFFQAWCIYTDFNISNCNTRHRLDQNRTTLCYDGTVSWPYMVSPKIASYVNQQMELRQSLDVHVGDREYINACFDGIPTSIEPIALQAHEMELVQTI